MKELKNENNILIKIKHNTKDPKEIKKYIIEAIHITNKMLKEKNISKYILKDIKEIIYVPNRIISILT